MTTPNILALSDSLPIAEWTTRLKGYAPFSPGFVPGHLVDDYVRPVTSRWLYSLIHTTEDAGPFLVHAEAHIDETGQIWWAPYSELPERPIPERLDPRTHGVPSTGVQFPMTDDKGRALSVRLLLSPFRLPSASVRELRAPGMVKSILHSIPPLWEWSKEDDPASPVHSREGYSLVEKQMWIRPEGAGAKMIWVGSDPFAIAERRSDLFVNRRRQYAKRFEPTDEDERRELSRILLAKSLRDAILRQPDVSARYAKYLDVPRMNRELKDFDDDEKKERDKYFKLAKQLCDHLTSPFFTLLQYASLEAEGFENDADRHEALAEHYRVLDRVTRSLSRCKPGLELLAKWGEEADTSPEHFINRMHFPANPMKLHVFRTVRWSSKSAFQVLRKLSPYLAATRGNAFERITAALVHLGIADATEVKDAIIKVRTTVGELAGGLKLKGPVKEVLELEIFGKKLLPKLEAFIEAGKENTSLVAGFLRNPTTAAVLGLDAINVYLGLQALMQASTVEEVTKAAAGAGAATGFIAATIGKYLADKAECEIAKIKYLRFAYAANAVCGVIYAALNAVAAAAAFQQDDDDRAIALLVAATAEIVSAVSYAALLFNPLAAAPAYLIVVSVVAALAYIAATLLENDPLAKVLEYCEWGVSPYSKPDYHPIWATKKVGAWKGDFNTQSRLILRVLTRLTITWNYDSWPGVALSINVNRPGVRLKTSFRAVFKGGKSLAESRVFEHADLPRSLPVKLDLTPRMSATTSGINRLWFSVVFEAHESAQAETLEVLLMDNGVGIRSGKGSFLE